MTYHSSERGQTRAPEGLRERMQASPDLDEAVTTRWREATPIEHGQALWGLLEFAELVQRGKETLPPVEPLLSLPKPFAERQTG